MSEKNEEIVRKTVSLPAGLWRRIDDFRFEVRLKRETHAVRQLIETGLAAHERAREQQDKPKSKTHR
jgi:hypothetical protein